MDGTGLDVGQEVSVNLISKLKWQLEEAALELRVDLMKDHVSGLLCGVPFEQAAKDIVSAESRMPVLEIFKITGGD